MNTEHINNAAGRLHRLLREIRGYNEQVNNPAPQVWAKILDVPDGDLPALLRRMALVVGLPDQAEREVKQIPDLDHQRYLVWRPKADSILANVNFQGKFGGIAGQIDDPTLSLLLICDDLIVKNAPALSIDVETLDGLLTEVRNLIDEVERSEVPQVLKGFILRHLHTIEQSIVDYQLQGIEALYAGLETTIGIARVNPEPFDDALKSPIGQKLAKILWTYVLLLNAVVGTRQLGEGVVKLLPGVDAIQAEETLEVEVVSGEPTGAAVEQEGAGS